MHPAEPLTVARYLATQADIVTLRLATSASPVPSPPTSWP